MWLFLWYVCVLCVCVCVCGLWYVCMCDVFVYYVCLGMYDVASVCGVCMWYTYVVYV